MLRTTSYLIPHAANYIALNTTCYELDCIHTTGYGPNRINITCAELRTSYWVQHATHYIVFNPTCYEPDNLDSRMLRTKVHLFLLFIAQLLLATRGTIGMGYLWHDLILGFSGTTYHQQPASRQNGSSILCQITMVFLVSP